MQNAWVLVTSGDPESAQRELGHLGGTAPPPGVESFPPGNVLLCVTLTIPQVLLWPQVHLLHQGAGEVVTQGDNAEGELPSPADILPLEILQVDHRLPADQGLLVVHRRDPGMSESLLDCEPFPGVFNQKLPNEVLGELTGLAEEFLVEVITHCCDIC